MNFPDFGDLEEPVDFTSQDVGDGGTLGDTEIDWTQPVDRDPKDADDPWEGQYSRLEDAGSNPEYVQPD